MSTKRSQIKQSAGELLEQIKKKNPAFRIEYSNYGPQSSQDYPLRGVFPVMFEREKSLTMGAYKLYVDRYNARVRSENRLIVHQRNLANTYFENFQDKQKLIFQIGGFNGRYRHLNKWEFNAKAREYNDKLGNQVIPLQKIQTVKQSTEKVFFTMLWSYSSQLKRYSELRRAGGQQYVRQIPQMDTNSIHLQGQKGAFGLHMLDYCRETIRKHKARLLECGILINRNFRGHEKGTTHHITPEILVVSDDFDGKSIVVENQLLIKGHPKVFGDIVLHTSSISTNNVNDVDKPTSIERKKSSKQHPNPKKQVPGFLPDSQPSVEGTSTPSGSNEKIEIATRENLAAPIRDSKDEGPGTTSLETISAPGNTPEKKDSGPLHVPRLSNSTSDTPRNADTSGRRPSLKTVDHPSREKGMAPDTLDNKDNAGSIALENSDFLLKTIQEDWAFACELGNKEHVNSQPINPENLVLEITSGNLNNAEFATVLCQDLFRQFSRLYYHACSKGFPWHKPWHEKYQEWLNSWPFVHKNGYVHTKKIAYRNYLRIKYALLSGRHGALNRVRHGNFELKANTIKSYLDAVNPKPGSFLFWYLRIADKAPKVDAHINKILASMKKRGMNARLYERDLIRLKRYFKKWEKHRDDMRLLRQVQENLSPEVIRDFRYHFQKFIQPRFIKKIA
ncbi:MAG: hypothetical protein AAF634_05035 [Bacteroidota bacterium]